MTGWATLLDLSSGPVAALDQGEKSECPSDEARGRRKIGAGKSANFQVAAMPLRQAVSLMGCVLAAVGITLKVKLDTPQGPQPLARAIVTTQLQKLRSDLALP